MALGRLNGNGLDEEMAKRKKKQETKL